MFSFCRDADAVILVYDTANKASFENIDRWVNSLEETISPICKILILSHNTHTEKRQVSRDQIDLIEARLNVEEEEVSLKDPYYIEQCMERLLKGRLIFMKM